MDHHYQIQGMTCSSCVNKVKSALLSLKHVTKVEASISDRSLLISMDEHVPLEQLQLALPEKYRIIESGHDEFKERSKKWFLTYSPVLLIFGYLLLVTVSVQMPHGSLDYMIWMQHFMAGFFLVFSFFKILNLKGFAESYSTYDIVAKQFPIWAYLYAFLELLLGAAYVVAWNPLVTNTITFIVMSISLIGVLQSVFNKRKIQCACLGAVFNLPMSTITIVEDFSMIVMSGIMIIQHF